MRDATQCRLPDENSLVRRDTFLLKEVREQRVTYMYPPRAAGNRLYSALASTMLLIAADNL